MLLSANTRPEATPYYCGGRILKALKRCGGSQSILDLYEAVKREDGMGSATFMLGLDWLYLLEAIDVDEEGAVVACS